MLVVFTDKMELFKKDKIIEKDLGFIEDTWGFLMDMVSYEDHCINQFLSSGDENELKELESMRKLRTHYLDLVAKKCIGNNWCKAKHLCRIGKGLQEDCTRFLSMGDINSAKQAALDYGEIYLKFIKLIGVENVSTNTTQSSA